MWLDGHWQYTSTEKRIQFRWQVSRKNLRIPDLNCWERMTLWYTQSTCDLRDFRVSYTVGVQVPGSLPQYNWSLKCMFSIVISLESLSNYSQTNMTLHFESRGDLISHPIQSPSANMRQTSSNIWVCDVNRNKRNSWSASTISSLNHVWPVDRLSWEHMHRVSVQIHKPALPEQLQSDRYASRLAVVM